MAGVCMRECETCSLRQEYGCRGCLESGGQPFWGSCQVVACCHSRGQQNCGQCGDGPCCSKVQEAQRRREEWPQKEAQLQAHWQAGMAHRTPVLAKWLPVLFWVLLCSRAVNLLDQLGITAGLQGAVTVVEVLTGLGLLVVYWKLAPLSRRLRTLWRLELVLQLVSVALLVGMFLAGDRFSAEQIPQDAQLGVVLGALGLVLGLLAVGLVVQCLFYGAMAEELEQSAVPSPPDAFQSVFQSLPQHLADNWRLLRKCVLGSLGAAVGGLILGILLGSLGGLGLLFVLLALAAAVVMIGCMVAELVILWKTSCFFRDALGDLPALPEGEP